MAEIAVAAKNPTGHLVLAVENAFCAIAFSPDSHAILVGDGGLWNPSGRAWLWDTSGESLGESHSDEGFIQCVAFSNDGREYATGTTDMQAPCCRAGLGRRYGERFGETPLHPFMFIKVALSPTVEHWRQLAGNAARLTPRREGRSEKCSNTRI